MFGTLWNALLDIVCRSKRSVTKESAGPLLCFASFVRQPELGDKRPHHNGHPGIYVGLPWIHVPLSRLCYLASHRSELIGICEGERKEWLPVLQRLLSQSPKPASFTITSTTALWAAPETDPLEITTLADLARSQLLIRTSRRELTRIHSASMCNDR